MLIMNSRKIIYVHIPKCGGTSVELALSEHCQWNDVLLGSSDLGEVIQEQYSRKFHLNKHSSAVEIANVIGEDVWRSFFSWSTVRNPFSRVTSLFNYVNFLIEAHAHDVGFPLDGSLPMQVAWATREDYPNTAPWNYPAVRAYLRACNHSSPFSAFLNEPLLLEDPAYMSQCSMLKKANKEIAVSEIIHLERLEFEWPRLCSKFDLSPIPLPKANVSQPRNRKRVCDLFRSEADIALVKQQFEEDFEHLKYLPDTLPE